MEGRRIVKTEERQPEFVTRVHLLEKILGWVHLVRIQYWTRPQRTVESFAILPGGPSGRGKV